MTPGRKEHKGHLVRQGRKDRQGHRVRLGRLVRRDQRREGEIILSAWCGPRRTGAFVATERQAQCRPAAANNPIIGLCAKLAGH